MAAYIRRPMTLFFTARTQTTLSSSPFLDRNFDTLMHQYKDFNKVVSIQQLLLSYPPSSSQIPPSIPINFLDTLSSTLHLDPSPTAFLRNYPHIFHIFYYPARKHLFCRLTQPALQLSCQEHDTLLESLPLGVDRLVRLLSMSRTKSFPFRAVDDVYRELGLPYDFEELVVLRNPHVFRLEGRNKDVLRLVKNVGRDSLVTAVEDWRVVKYCSEDWNVDRSELRYCFNHNFPPGTRLGKGFKAWQRLPYVGPYDRMEKKRIRKAGSREMEKRAVGVIHEFLSITVEKMVEVEKIIQFIKWFGIDFNVKDLVVGYPGMFYLSTKGNRQTVFLREAYERGRLIEPNPIYEVRMKLLDFVRFGRPEDLNELDNYET